MMEVESDTFHLIDDVLASGLATKSINRFRVKLDRFITLWECMKEEEASTYFAEVIFRRLQEIAAEFDGLPRTVLSGKKKSVNSSNRSTEQSYDDTSQQQYVLHETQGQMDKWSRVHLQKANFLRLLYEPLVTISQPTATLRTHLLRIKQTLLSTLHLLFTFYFVDCSDASLYSAIVGVTGKYNKSTGFGDDEVSLLDIWNDFVITQALARDGAVVPSRTLGDILRCGFVSQDLSANFSKEMLDKAIRLVAEHMPRYGKVEGYDRLSFGYGIYLTYMQICDSCSTMAPEDSASQLILDMLRDQASVSDQTVSCLLVLFQRLLDLYAMPQRVILDALDVIVTYKVRPLPIGAVASAVIDKLVTEIKAPGHHTRQHLHRTSTYLLQAKKSNHEVQMCRVFMNVQAYHCAIYAEQLKRFVKYREALLATFKIESSCLACYRRSLVSAMLVDGW